MVQQSLQCLTDLLGSPPEAPELLVTLIASRHAQAFEGFLQVDDYILAKGDLGKSVVGTKELFLGHEIAHQWWGHATTWDSYRDQWLSEALAEYSSALCVRRTLPNGEKIFRKILDAFTHEAIGSLGAGSNPFARPGLALGNSSVEEANGPDRSRLASCNPRRPGCLHFDRLPKGSPGRPHARRAPAQENRQSRCNRRSTARTPSFTPSSSEQRRN